MFRLLLFVHQAESKTHPVVFVDLGTDGVSKDPVRTVQIGRMIRMPVQREVTEATPCDERANVAKI